MGRDGRGEGGAAVSTTYILQVNVSAKRGEAFGVSDYTRLEEALQDATGTVHTWRGCVQSNGAPYDFLTGLFSFEHKTLPGKPESLLRRLKSAAKKVLPDARYVWIALLDSDRADWYAGETRRKGAA